MIQKLSFIIGIVLLVGCSRIEVPAEPPSGRTTTQAPQSDQDTSRKSPPVTGSARQNYNKAYNLFKVHHRHIFELVNENRFALRNEGKKSVQSVEDMYSLLSKSDQSRLEKALDEYREAWNNFDLKSPSVGDRQRLKSAGKKIRNTFQPDQVELAGSTDQPPRNTDNTGSTDDGSPEVVSGTSSTDRNVRVANPERYNRLYDRWKKLHEQFQHGLESSDPLLASSYKELLTVLRKMVEEVQSDKEVISRYFISQYQLIYQQRNRFAGTNEISDHLSVLKSQFSRMYSPGNN